MHWNHRVMRRTYDDRYIQYGIYEVYYFDDGTISYTDEPVYVVGESLDDLRQSLEWMQNSLDKPVLDWNTGKEAV